MELSKGVSLGLSCRPFTLPGVKPTGAPLAPNCNAFKIDTCTVAEVCDVLAYDIIVNRHADPGLGNPVPSGDCIAAIALELNETTTSDL